MNRTQILPERPKTAPIGRLYSPLSEQPRNSSPVKTTPQRRLEPLTEKEISIYRKQNSILLNLICDLPIFESGEQDIKTKSKSIYMTALTEYAPSYAVAQSVILQTYLLLERLITGVNGKQAPSVEITTLLITTLILAVKYFDDLAVWLSDFNTIFSKFNIKLEDIFTYETFILDKIQYDFMNSEFYLLSHYLRTHTEISIDLIRSIANIHRIDNPRLQEIRKYNKKEFIEAGFTILETNSIEPLRAFI